MDQAWGPARLGLSSLSCAPVTTELGALHTPAADGSEHQLLSLSNPLLAVCAIAGLTIGLAAFSTSVRVGHTTAKLAVGTT